MNYETVFNYMKTFRERTGISLQDMASIVGMNVGNLSKIESNQVTPNIQVVLAYHLIFDIPIERIFKNHYSFTINECLYKANNLRQELMDEKSSSSVFKRLDFVDIITQRLKKLQKKYEGTKE